MNLLGACSVALALLLPATPAFAQAINRAVRVTDSTDPDTKGDISHVNASNTGTGETTCRNGADTARFLATTTHPDSVRLAGARARMDQRVGGNFPTLRVIATGGRVFNIVLSCLVATYRSDVDYRVNVNQGSFRVDAQNCTGLNQVQTDFFRDTCAADVANETIRVETDGMTILRVRLRGSGNFEYLP